MTAVGEWGFPTPAAFRKHASAYGGHSRRACALALAARRIFMAPPHTARAASTERRRQWRGSSAPVSRCPVPRICILQCTDWLWGPPRTIIPITAGRPDGAVAPGARMEKDGKKLVRKGMPSIHSPRDIQMKGRALIIKNGRVASSSRWGCSCAIRRRKKDNSTRQPLPPPAVGRHARKPGRGT